MGESYEVRSKIVEDIKQVEVEKKKVIIYGSRCSKCGKIHEGIELDVLKGNQIGNNVLLWSIYLHFFIGVSCRNIVTIFNKLLSFPITAGCLVHNWHRISDILEISYEKLQKYIEKTGYVHCDESGWRVFGNSWWAWVFTNSQCCLYFITKSRSSQVVKELLGDFYSGILISDFYSVYGLIQSFEKQKCFSHIFTELKKCLQRDNNEELRLFS